MGTWPGARKGVCETEHRKEINKRRVQTLVRTEVGKRDVQGKGDWENKDGYLKYPQRAKMFMLMRATYFYLPSHLSNNRI